MRYIFFHLYNRLYQDGKLVRNSPEWVALGLVIVGTFFWFMLLSEIYYFYICNVNFPDEFDGVSTVISFLIILSLYFILVYRKRYEKIYAQYKNLDIKQRKRGFLIAIMYVFLPIVIGAFITLKWHGKI